MLSKKYLILCCVMIDLIHNRVSAAEELPLLSPGRIQLTLAGVTGIDVLSGDAMLPFATKNNGFAYADMMSDRAFDDTYTVSPGIGYRLVYDDQIWGAYFFGDYEKTSLGANFWNLSPGVEWITPQWDAHINAYFPTQTSQQISSTNYASNFNNNDYVQFETGTNIQNDMLQTPYSVIGTGVDTEVGYSFDMNDNHLRSRAYLGFYYYQTPNDTTVDNITGITSGISQAVSPNTTISLFNSYDQVSHYNIGVSITVTFGGGSSIFSQNINDRLLDPVQRHIGIIDTGATNYDQEDYENQGMAQQYDNVYFVSPDGTGTGVYGDPASLNDVFNIASTSSDGARIYIQGGENANYTSNESLDVYANESVYGRNNDYTAPASADEQPDITFTNADIGFFIANPGNYTFSDLYIHSTAASSTSSGIYVTNNSNDNLTLNLENLTISQFATGVYLKNDGDGIFTLNSNNSSFSNNTATGYQGYAYGMNAVNTGSGKMILNIVNSLFNNNTASGENSQAAGLVIENNGTGFTQATILNSEFNHNSITSGSGYANSVGLYAQNSNTGALSLIINQTQFNNNVSNVYQAYGLELVNISSGSATASIYQSQFNDNSAVTRSAGLFAYNSGEGMISLNVQDSMFMSNTAQKGYGMLLKNTGEGDVDVADENNQYFGNTTASIKTVD